MKSKSFLSVAGLLSIAILILSSFTFSNGANINKKFKKSEVRPASELGDCVTRFRTLADFTECDRTHTTTEFNQAELDQFAILEKY